VRAWWSLTRPYDTDLTDEEYAIAQEVFPESVGWPGGREAKCYVR
jgi:hypothetical protein